MMSTQPRFVCPPWLSHLSFLLRSFFHFFSHSLRSFISLRWSQNDSSSHHSPHLGAASRLRYSWGYLRGLERRDLAMVWRKLLQVIRSALSLMLSQSRLNHACTSDLVDNMRTLWGIAQYVNNSAMTIEMCLDACASQGFNIAGVEYSRECC